MKIDPNILTYIGLFFAAGTFLVGGGILVKIWSVAETIGKFEQWTAAVESRLARIDKESASSGTLMQQQGQAISRIEGRLETKFEDIRKIK